MAETDVIGHLLNIEHQAAELLLDTQTEADRRLTEARAKADAEYKTQYEQLIRRLEAEYAAAAAEIEKNHSGIMHEYRNTVDATETDPVSFGALLDSLLFTE
ncbi:hypothetical protein [Treponema brennaborense]|uniref:Uncharacterized protein n=1 Tax=Treponema brennaborense (strain DSM 12168 / CIP 105900 / DD5/3) TaxID=906968 RepID=F4LQ48_TREBD|nr:hypothetical protein [Treponema brennaborense]AEE17126.1 hypothetical protein Trebr_1704 [Treponema brennaborense DSM 12168]